MIQTAIQPLDSQIADANKQQFVGDLLLRFGSQAESITSRNSNRLVQVVAHQNEWSLYAFPTNSQWKGYPMMNFSFANWDVWLLGEIYGCSDSQYVRAIVKDSIEQGKVTQLNGHYLLLGWNSEKQEWNIWTNRLGTVHCYYAEGSNPLIGTCFKSVAKATSQEFDEFGLLGFFTFGFFPQNRTYFKNVKILRPSTHEVYDSTGKLSKSERYWNWQYKPDQNRSYEDTVHEFGHLLNQVTNDLCSTGKIAIPISGGLDSRSTVAALNSNDPKLNNLWSYSYGYSRDSIETKIARQIASARNLAFDSFSISPYLFDLLPSIMDAVEGFQDLTQTRQAAVNSQLRDHSDYVIAAHWGDVWLDSFEIPEKQTEEEMISIAIKKFRKRGSDWLTQNICQSLLKNQAADDILREMIRQELKALTIDEPQFRLKALKTEQWSFRWTVASLRAYQLAVYPRLPFYDIRMIDFFNTVPSSYVQNRQLQIDYLKRFASDLARIKWQSYDTNLYNYRHFNTWLLPKRILKKVQRMISRRSVVQRNWEVQFLTDSGRTALRQYLCNGPGSKIEQFVSRNKIDELLSALFSLPTPQNGYATSMLLTFAASLENYV